MRYLWALCVVAALWAQAPKDVASTGRIEGRVVTSKGAGVLGAEVLLGQRLGRDDERSATLTDAQGRFAFEGIPPAANYTLYAKKTGYLPGQYGAGSTPAQPAVFTVKAGETVKDLSIAIDSQAVLTGRILDAAGDPLAEASVIVMQNGYRNGLRTLWRPVREQTNDLGEFRAAGLAAGRYYVAVHGAKGATTFYPAALDPRAAEAIEVAGGEEKRIEIRMPRLTAVSVRGKVLDAVPAEGSDTRMEVRLQPEALANGLVPGAVMLAFASKVDAQGGFDIADVPPGEYKLEIITIANSLRRTIGSMPLRVGGTDVNGLAVKSTAGAKVMGKLTVEGDTVENLAQAQVARPAAKGPASAKLKAAPEPGGLQVTLNRADVAAPSFNARVSNEGAFALEGLAAGRYYVTMGNLPGTYIKALRWEGKDVTHGVLEIQDSGTLEVVLSKGAVQARGTVVGNTEAVMVVLWPEVAQPLMQNSGAQLGLPRAWAFTTSPMAPGTYFYLGFEVVGNSSPVTMRALLDQFAAQAKKVVIGSGEVPVLETTVVPAAKIQEVLEKLP
jgi:hypothetical protein